MRYIPLAKATPGMILGQEILDSSGRILVGRGHELTEAYIAKLRRQGFDGIYIEDAMSEGIVIEPVIPAKLRMRGLEGVKERNVEQCKDVSRQIVREIVKGGLLSLDMTDLRSYDEYIYAHSVSVAVISCVIGVAMKLKNEDLGDLVTAALLHDLGKMEIPQDIMDKPGRLTPEEYQIIKSHATLSYRAVCRKPNLSDQVKDAVLYHHENLDGSGYPEGLSGNEIPLLARILHVADVYDALISRRPFKEAYSPHEASEYLMGGCGIMFDQNVVEHLLKYVPLFQKGSEVILSDGRIGVVYENSGIHNLRPVVRLLDRVLIDLSEPEYFNITLRTLGENESDPIYAEMGRKEMLEAKERCRIMAVDDMKTNLQALREVLESDYEMVLLKSGEQALHYLEKQSYPDLILLDIDMPEMNGIEAAKRIQTMTGGSVPIIFVTALGDRETVLTCRQLNVSGYVLRPFNSVFIRSEIRRVLTGRSDVD